jgi:hypothetical protein
VGIGEWLGRATVPAGASPAFGSAPRSKIDPWPIWRSCWAFWPADWAASSTASIPFRDAPLKPKAPHLISASIAFLLTARGSTRAQKSHSELNGPPCSRARLIACTAWCPTPLTASRPKRMLPPTTTNSWSDSLTSGGRISIPISSQRATKNGTLSLVDMTDEISAAMYSAG